MSLLLTRKSQRGSTTTTVCEEHKNPFVHDSPCSIINPTDIEGQPEFSPPRSYFSTTRFAISIWPFRAHKKSPSLGSHSDSCTSHAPLRPDSNKMQIPSRPTSTDSYTLHYGIKNKEIGSLSLNAIPQSSLDIPPTFTTSIPLHSRSHSLTTSQQGPRSSQLVTHQLSDDQPIRRFTAPPDIGQVPVYVPKERPTHRHSPTHEIPQGKRESRDLDQSAVSVAVIEVHTETLYHYDPPQTGSSPTAHRRDKSVGTMNSSGQEVGTSIS